MIRALQIKIHVGCKQLGLDAEARRQLQLVETGKESMSDMTAAELQKVLNRLKADGFKPASKGGSKSVKKRGLAPRGDLRLCHVLWSKLGEAGHLDHPGRDGLNKFIRSRFGDSWGSVPADIDMLRDANQITAIIRALRSWCDREGIQL